MPLDYNEKQTKETPVIGWRSATNAGADLWPHSSESACPEVQAKGGEDIPSLSVPEPEEDGKNEYVPVAGWRSATNAGADPNWRGRPRIQDDVEEPSETDIPDDGNDDVQDKVAQPVITAAVSPRKVQTLHLDWHVAFCIFAACGAVMFLVMWIATGLEIAKVLSFVFLAAEVAAVLLKMLRWKR